MSGKNHDPLSVSFTCKDLKRSLAFYEETLGFEVENVWPSREAPLWVNLMMQSQSLMLGQQTSAEQALEMCAGADPARQQVVRAMAEDLARSKPGAGVTVYVRVLDVDAHHALLARKGLKDLCPPQSQFYGIRDFPVRDPDGYHVFFYTEIRMQQCQSCAMPLQDAQPGQMYCAYCTAPDGRLKPYETVLEGTITGYFMGMQKMARPQAERAAREHLSKQPAWMGRK